MTIRKATTDDFNALWRGPELAGRQFAAHLANNTAELWIAEENEKVIGRIYFFTALTDDDFANGSTRAYITNFHVKSSFRGQGIGTQLINAIFTRLKQRGFTEATIGVDEAEESNARMYEKLGFTNTIKKCSACPICTDDNGNPFDMSEFLLLMKTLD